MEIIMKQNLKKIGGISLGIILFVVGATVTINWWIDAKLPQIISKKNETPYHIQYKELKISLLSKTIVAKGVSIVPKEREKDSLSKNGIFATVETITIDNFAIFPLLFSNKIEAQTLAVNNPKVTLYKENNKTINSTKSISSRVVTPFQKIIKVNDVNLEQGSFSIIHIKNNETLFSAQNVTVQLDDIVISDETLKQKIPFRYKKYAFSCDSLYYQTDDLYLIKSNKVNTTNTGLEVNQFSMVSKLNRRQFVNQLDQEKDLYTLKATKIAIKNMDWGFKKDIFSFQTHQILIEKAHGNIYRSKIPHDDVSIKPLYNKLLRELTFDLKVDTLKISDSKLVYEEEKTFEKGPGILEFTHFNLNATHIQSGFQQKKLPDVVIAIDCKFMKTAPMKIDWRFNVMDKSDGFAMKGRILNFDTGKLAVFTKPYLNATTKGIFEQLYFNFAGTDIQAVGNFALKYRDLKVKLYQNKNRDKESKFKSWIANLLLTNDSDGKLIEYEVAVERVREKSFFNYFWLCIAQGLKKTLI